MTKQTKTLVLIAIIAVVLGVVVSLVISSNKFTVPSVISEPTPKLAQPPPSVEIIPDAPKTVTFSYSGTTRAQATLPGFHFSWKRRTVGDILSIAKSLGFVNPPVRKRSEKNTIYVWSTSSSTLYLHDNGITQAWEYALSFSKEKSLINDQSAEAGKKFLESIFPFPKDISFVLKNESSGPFDGIVIQDSPRTTLRGYYFSFMTEAIPIVTSGFNMSPISTIIDSYGVIRVFSFSDPPLIESNDTYQLISPSDAVASLNKGLGLLIFVGMDDNYAFFDASPSFTSVSLNSFSLVYYPDNITMSLLPFYIFDGVATNSDGSPLRVSYTVSAIEEQNY